MNSILANLVNDLVWYTFGVFNFYLYLGLALKGGGFFRRNTEQDRLQLAIARDQFWNIDKTVGGLYHRFFQLRNGLQLHYLINRPASIATDLSPSFTKPLVILLHGFPDSCIMWRHLLKSSSWTDNATVIAVDLPGYGGSDSFDSYGPENVLEALTEFIVAMREKYNVTGEVDWTQAQSNAEGQGNQVLIVGHDWGCVLAYRLAAEAPCLADRFVVTNGPLVPLALDNKDRILDSSRKMVMTFFHAPLRNYHCLHKALNTVKPLLWQILLFGYIAAFHLPSFMVKYLGTGGNYSFLRGAQRVSYGKDESEYKVAESMACTLGPSPEECKNRKSDNSKVSGYGASVLIRAHSPATLFMHQTAYYRDGASTDKWDKSLETIAALHNIEIENASFENSLGKRRTSSSASSGIFDNQHKGALRAPTTVLWGQGDQACSERICLEGIGDFLAKESLVVLLPRAGHWTPVEGESRVALARVLQWYVDGGQGDMVGPVRDVYPDVKVKVRK